MTVTVNIFNTVETTAQHLRNGWGFGLGAPHASLQVRSGVRWSNGLDFEVTTSGLTATVKPGQAVLQSPTFAQGGYVLTSDANQNLTIGNRHATLTRIDTVYLMIRDDGVDSSGFRDGRILLQPGTAGSGVPPTLTGHVLKIADITVPPGSALLTVTDRRLWSASLGGMLRCRTLAEITSASPGQLLYEESTERIFLRRGVTWEVMFRPPDSWSNFQPAWFQSDFLSFSGFQLRYWVEPGGFVSMSGRITRSGGGGNMSGSLPDAVILPAALRPAVPVMFAVGIATNSSLPSATARVDIETTGDVNLFIPGSQVTQFVAFDGIRYATFV